MNEKPIKNVVSLSGGKDSTAMILMMLEKNMPVDKRDIIKIGVKEMLHNEARELLVEAYEKTGNAKEAAECFAVDKSTVYRLSRQKKATGSVKLRTNKRGRKPSLSPEDLSNIDKVIKEQSDITIDEIIEKLLPDTQ